MSTLPTPAQTAGLVADLNAAVERSRRARGAHLVAARPDVLTRPAPVRRPLKWLGRLGRLLWWIGDSTLRLAITLTMLLVAFALLTGCGSSGSAPAGGVPGATWVSPTPTAPPVAELGQCGDLLDRYVEARQTADRSTEPERTWQGSLADGWRIMATDRQCRWTRDLP